MNPEGHGRPPPPPASCSSTPSTSAHRSIPLSIDRTLRREEWVFIALNTCCYESKLSNQLSVIVWPVLTESLAFLAAAERRGSQQLSYLTIRTQAKRIGGYGARSHECSKETGFDMIILQLGSPLCHMPDLSVGRGMQLDLLTINQPDGGDGVSSFSLLAHLSSSPFSFHLKAANIHHPGPNTLSTERSGKGPAGQIYGVDKI
ncbi:unnamed protein product [Pleuronectes platessa]|uniref:Uncharacterized protein n=1 Tax=Pleuronectes platessa TaxID=8262 RepID=A0A9N7UQJ0_PLEPL|nr:unnamed protein product [Pleuronectes platessa]